MCGERSAPRYQTTNYLIGADGPMQNFDQSVSGLLATYDIHQHLFCTVRNAHQHIQLRQTTYFNKTNVD